MMRRVSAELEQWLENFNRLMQELLEKGFKQTPTNAREGLANLTRTLVSQVPQVAWVQDDLVSAPGHSVPVRIYHPDPGSRLPILVYYHGGGHMAGSVTVYDPICCKLALATRHIVISADYRLAPECPYPAAIHDAYCAAKFAGSVLQGRGFDYRPQLSIAGDSAGGALCATVAHIAQYDAGLAIARQALIYPSLDYTMNSASMEENARGYLLHKEKIAWYFDHYFQQAENRKAASPLHMEFTDRLPETLVVTAGFCPLRDEGIAYAGKAKSAGIYTEHLHFDELIHAFMNMEDLVKTSCETVYRRIGAFLNAQGRA
jgi:acetyl esterase/lipase